ncbi:MAG: histidine kinase dimerization/phospho-acceptor domain-containing protein, partial [Acetatifactor sp.]
MLKKFFQWILYLLLCFCIFTAVIKTCNIILLVPAEDTVEEEETDVTQAEYDKAKSYLGCRLMYLYFTEGPEIVNKITVELGVRYEIYRYSGSKVAGNMETYRYSNGMGLHYSRSMAGKNYVDEMEDHYIKLYLKPNSSFQISDVDSAYQKVMQSSVAQSSEGQYPEDYLYLAGSLLLGSLLLILLLKTTGSVWPEGSFLLQVLPPEVLLACLIPGSIRVWQCFIHDRLFAYLSEGTPLDSSLFWLIGLVMTDTFFGVHLLSRFHQPDWYKKSILFKIFRALWNLFFQLKLSFRVLLGGLFLTALELSGIVYLLPPAKNTIIFMVLLCLEKLVTIPAAMYYAAYFRRFHQAAKEISSGNLTYQLDTTHMPKKFRALSTDINSIGDALSVAVAESVKSEHLKTELITNVSHDIKTPLTSIINFSDLIEREPSENNKITEYAE